MQPRRREGGGAKRNWTNLDFCQGESRIVLFIFFVCFICFLVVSFCLFSFSFVCFFLFFWYFAVHMFFVVVARYQEKRYKKAF